MSQGGRRLLSLLVWPNEPSCTVENLAKVLQDRSTCPTKPLVKPAEQLQDRLETCPTALTKDRWYIFLKCIVLLVPASSHRPIIAALPCPIRSCLEISRRTRQVLGKHQRWYGLVIRPLDFQHHCPSVDTLLRQTLLPPSCVGPTWPSQVERSPSHPRPKQIVENSYALRLNLRTGAWGHGAGEGPACACFDYRLISAIPSITKPTANGRRRQPVAAAETTGLRAAPPLQRAASPQYNCHTPG